MGSPIVLLVVMIVFGGLILLETRLSKKKNKWLGLIIPIIFFILATVCVAGLIRYDIKYKNTTNKEQVSENEVVENDKEEKSQEANNIESKHDTKSSGDYIIMSIFYLLLANIPNYVLLAVYFTTRESMGYRKKSFIEEKLYKNDKRGR